jgi:hypothetical protein
MTISVIATCWTTQYDLSNWVIKDSIKIDTHLFTDSLEPNTNSAEFVLSRTCPYLDELLAYDDAIGVSVAADGTTYFTGYFTDSFRFSITSRGAQDVKIECEDPGIRKLKTAWVSADGIGTTFAGDKICDPADTAHSVIHKIATRAGVTLASSLPTISQQVYMVVLDKDGRTYWDVLSKLLLEHLYVFDFNAAGQLYLFALTGMTGSPVQTLTTQEGIIGDNSTPGIVVNKRLYDTREIDIKFDEISTVASGVVHRDTTGQTANYDCLIPIAPGKYYPDTCNADTYAYIDYKTEDGRDVVMVDSATLDVSTSGIMAEFANLGKSARIRFYNGGGTTQYIYRLKVNATNIRVKSANSKVIAGETSRHKREIDASTITTKAEAQQYGNLLYYYYKNSKQVYQFRGYRGLLYPSDSLYPAETLYPNGDLIEPGEIIRLYDPIFTGLDATVMVTRKRYTLGRSGAEYDAIGIGTINLADATVCLPVAQTPSTPITAIYPAQKPLTSLTDIVDFNGQYGIYGGVRYKGTMPNTWTADDKSIIAARVFYNTPTVPYAVGDLWVRDNTLFISSVDKPTGEFSELDWEWCIRSNITTVVESSNGDVFKPTQSMTTILTPRCFRNGLEITSTIPDSAFCWTRVSFYPQSPPNDDATWNANHAAGYRTIEVTCDSIYARATYVVEIFE